MEFTTRGTYSAFVLQGTRTKTMPAVFKPVVSNVAFSRDGIGLDRELALL